MRMSKAEEKRLDVMNCMIDLNIWLTQLERKTARRHYKKATVPAIAAIRTLASLLTLL